MFVPELSATSKVTSLWFLLYGELLFFVLIGDTYLWLALSSFVKPLGFWISYTRLPWVLNVVLRLTRLSKAAEL